MQINFKIVQALKYFFYLKIYLTSESRILILVGFKCFAILGPKLGDKHTIGKARLFIPSDY